MVTILRVHLPSEIPIVGCELIPYVLVRRPDHSISNEDVPESAPLNDHILRYKWYRIQSDRQGLFCSIHPSEEATLQCTGCVKAKIPVAQSYHCTSKCFCDAWQHHRAMHERGNRAEEMAEINIPVYHAQRKAGETWFEVGQAKTYTPTAADIGHVLKFECVVVNVETKLAVGQVNTIVTSKVISAPTPCPRKLIPVSGADVNVRFDPESRVSSAGTFTVLSYNILSDLYARSESCSYCPPWALTWTYRRQNLLREILCYRADIVCLQEVQHNHFEDFFGHELDKNGYQAILLKKTQEVATGVVQANDGIAIIFRRDRFSLHKKYEVEFNKTAQPLTEKLPSGQKRPAQDRILKEGNVALIVILEAKFSNPGVDNAGNGQLLCVANTHINTPQALNDVKIWQVHTLIKGLEKIASNTEIPMLVCGDFNAVPGSAPHALLAIGKVDPKHPDLSVDPFGILRPLSKLTHQLPLVSAYSAFARVESGLGLEQYRTRMNPNTHEPLFTNYTRDFIGTVDYIFYSADTLSVESLLELLDEDSLRKNTALPSPEWSSDHIALMAEFRYKPKTRRC